jgi:hypothetical protein
LVRIDFEAKALAVMSGALGIAAVMTLGAPSALADPVPPPPEPVPAPAPAPAPPPLLPWLPAAAPAIPPPAPPPGPADGTVQAAAGDPALPPQEVPHLSSPENLPPGTTETPDPQAGSGSYLRDLWHAYQTQEISGRDALLLLTQRPADAAPPPGMPANPTPPMPPAPPLPEAAPAPPPVP